MADQGPQGLERLVKAAGYSWLGLKAAFHHEAAFRQVVALNVIGVPLGLWIGQNRVERALLCASLLMCLVVELLNSAIEAIVDRIGAERHPLSGRAKDMGSAAQFMALAIAALVWLLLLI